MDVASPRHHHHHDQDHQAHHDHLHLLKGGDGATPWLALASHARRPRNGCRLPQILCN